MSLRIYKEYRIHQLGQVDFESQITSFASYMRISLPSPEQLRRPAFMILVLRSLKIRSNEYFGKQFLTFYLLYHAETKWRMPQNYCGHNSKRQ